MNFKKLLTSRARNNFQVGGVPWHGLGGCSAALLSAPGAGAQHAGQRGLRCWPTNCLRNERLPSVQYLQVSCKREILDAWSPGLSRVREAHQYLSEAVWWRKSQRLLLLCLQSEPFWGVEGRWGVAESERCTASKGELGLLQEGI